MSGLVAETYAFTTPNRWLVRTGVLPDGDELRYDSLLERSLWRSRGIREVEEARWKREATGAFSRGWSLGYGDGCAVAWGTFK